MLNRIARFFVRTNEPEVDAPSVLSCMTHLATRLSKHLDSEYYRWKDNERAKKFECLILSKFMMCHALLSTGRVPEARKQFYLKMTDSVFETSMKTGFPWLDVPEAIKAKFEAYSDIMSDVPHPACWQLLAGACTGVDYHSEKNQPALAASSLILPALLRFAQDFWEKLTKSEEGSAPSLHPPSRVIKNLVGPDRQG
jgi:hypothetical protein